MSSDTQWSSTEERIKSKGVPGKCMSLSLGTKLSSRDKQVDHTYMQNNLWVGSHGYMHSLCPLNFKLACC